MSDPRHRRAPAEAPGPRVVQRKIDRCARLAFPDDRPSDLRIRATLQVRRVGTALRPVAGWPGACSAGRLTAEQAGFVSGRKYLCIPFPGLRLPVRGSPTCRLAMYPKLFGRPALKTAHAREAERAVMAVVRSGVVGPLATAPSPWATRHDPKCWFEEVTTNPTKSHLFLLKQDLVHVSHRFDGGGWLRPIRTLRREDWRGRPINQLEVRSCHKPDGA